MKFYQGLFFLIGCVSTSHIIALGLLSLTGCASTEANTPESPWANVEPLPAPLPPNPTFVPPKPITIIDPPVVDPAQEVAKYGYRTERRQVGTTRAILPRNRQPIYADVQVWTGPVGTEPKRAVQQQFRTCGPGGCR